MPQPKHILFAITFLLISYCCNNSVAEKAIEEAGENKAILHTTGNKVSTRFSPPAAFTRIAAQPNSFETYLRNIPLKPDGTKVKLYNGKLKSNENAAAAVLDVEVGTENLQQCADAVMRLRAEYLYSTKQYSKIHFNFTNGFRADYSEWMKGNRIIVKGETVSWKKLKEPSHTYNDFREYMYMVFRYAGSLSLSKELKPVSIHKIQPGDVFILGGSPGHAVLVIDVAENKVTGKKVFMLAQSYMPAQDIHILVNDNNPDISPWYEMPEENLLQTPEWTFTTNQLMRFVEE
ncbi:MAG: DUF4846 domain-containing protein [Bacteroidia bacterium]